MASSRKPWMRSVRRPRRRARGRPARPGEGIPGGCGAERSRIPKIAFHISRCGLVLFGFPGTRTPLNRCYGARLLLLCSDLSKTSLGSAGKPQIGFRNNRKASPALMEIALLVQGFTRAATETPCDCRESALRFPSEQAGGFTEVCLLRFVESVGVPRLAKRARTDGPFVLDLPSLGSRAADQNALAGIVAQRCQRQVHEDDTCHFQVRLRRFDSARASAAAVRLCRPADDGGGLLCGAHAFTRRQAAKPSKPRLKTSEYVDGSGTPGGGADPP